MYSVYQNIIEDTARQAKTTFAFWETIFTKEDGYTYRISQLVNSFNVNSLV
jgi:hypothetical protein